ncbi:SH3 domain-binding protein 5-like [Ostrea edulis]|uniref:SH3 domain-binding protein 5-like n=1 Tax=Ostrea edulis TaxID=37623 RepID=UPI0024AF5453|nr:SH3 domain-binding protein 5-like [Ostrea edulis]
MSETESVDLEREELGKYADLFSLEVAKPVRLSLHLIVQRHLPPDARNWSHDKILEALQKITHLRLDRENISEIDGLELLGERVTNVYLQSNIIKRIENFECLKNLQFLTLSGNQIQSIENLKHLQRLFFLDLSFNLINDFDIDEFPMSLIILNLKGNPCTSHPDHRGRIIQDLPKLKQLDDVEISSEEKLEAGFKTEESEEEEEDDDDNEEIDKEIPGKDTAEFKDITQLTNSTLVRSQQREDFNVLNQTSSEINRLENELDEARCNYKMTFTEASQRLAQAAEKRKKNIQRARPYFELKEEAKQAQGESLRAARQYQSAISVYRAAKETVMLAEERLLQKGEGSLSAAWQEMMNHATMRVMEAEREKRQSEERHQIATSRCAQCEKRLKQLQKKFKTSIIKAGPYFEVKHELDVKLQHQKQNVTDLHTAIKDAKIRYTKALGNLEKISEEIHQSRREKIMLMFPRQPGVGAESGSSLASAVPEINLEEAELDNLAEDSDSIFEEDDDNKADEGISINCPSDPGCATDRLESDGSILTRREIYCHMKSENKSESTEKMSTTSDHRDTRSHTPSMEQ